MTKRAAEEAPPSLESGKSGPDIFGYCEAQVAELLSQKERIPLHEHRATKKSSTEIVGAEMSNLKREKLNALLRQCIRDFIPEVDEMQSRVLSMRQLKSKKPLISPTNPECVTTEDPTVQEDIQLLMRSDPSLVKEIMRKQSDDLSARLDNIQQQLEKVRNNVVSTCRPMSLGEKKDLQKSLKELPEKNLELVAEIIKDHYVAMGKGFSDEVIVNMEEADNLMLWRLYFHVGAVKRAWKLAS